MTHPFVRTAAAAAIALGLLVARAAGDPIGAKNKGSLLDWVGVRMEQPPEVRETSSPIQMVYRQAGLFVAFLHDSDPVAYAAMMRMILDGHPFGEAVETGYHTDLQALWLRFVQSPGK